ncbi:MAG: hypothetical protein GY752_01810 [bacterium]|nr:hypothetical protein [bacterium]
MRKILILLAVMTINASALTIDVISDVTVDTNWTNDFYFSLNEVMSEVTEVRLVAHINVIEVPTIHSDDLNMTLPWGFRLYCEIDGDYWENIWTRQIFHSTSSGDYYIDIIFEGNHGNEFMIDSDELRLRSEFLPLNGIPGWEFISCGEIYIDYFTLEVNGVLPTVDMSMGRLKLLFR